MGLISRVSSRTYRFTFKIGSRLLFNTISRRKMTSNVSAVSEKLSVLKTKELNADNLKLIDEIQDLIKGVGDMNMTSKLPQRNTTTQEPKKSKPSKLKLKCAKGTRDFGPRQMATRKIVFDAIREIFEKHGGETIDTPVFELRSTLMDKYGEDSKLIYDLQDQGGEILSLRYDLTVPFARFCGMNKIRQIKRYHIAKVYRRDQPAIDRGRFREFYQCDFDITGTFENMVPDAEILKIMSEIIGDKKLNLGKFTIKVNDRKILDGMLKGCGVSDDKIRSVCSAVDKLDKKSWADVKSEMVSEKGLSEAVADKIGEYVTLNGRLNDDGSAINSPAQNLIQKLQNDESIQNDSLKTGLQDMTKLLNFCSILGIKSELCFDLSLARGLDYYTGPIYEAVLEGKNVGSICGGRRYDGLVNQLAGTKQSIPCVGTSFGIERIMAIIEKQKEKENVKTVKTKVLVMSPFKNTLEQRLKLLNILWNAGIAAETHQKNNVKMLSQLQDCENRSIAFGITIGPDEIERGVVKLRHVVSREEWEVDVECMVEELEKAFLKEENDGF